MSYSYMTYAEYSKTLNNIKCALKIIKKYCSSKSFKNKTHFSKEIQFFNIIQEHLRVVCRKEMNIESPSDKYETSQAFFALFQQNFSIYMDKHNCPPTVKLVNSASPYIESIIDYGVDYIEKSISYIQNNKQVDEAIIKFDCFLTLTEIANHISQHQLCDALNRIKELNRFLLTGLPQNFYHSWVIFHHDNRMELLKQEEKDLLIVQEKNILKESVNEQHLSIINKKRL